MALFLDNDTYEQAQKAADEYAPGDPMGGSPVSGFTRAQGTSPMPAPPWTPPPYGPPEPQQFLGFQRPLTSPADVQLPGERFPGGAYGEQASAASQAVPLPAPTQLDRFSQYVRNVLGGTFEKAQEPGTYIPGGNQLQRQIARVPVVGDVGAGAFGQAPQWILGGGEVGAARAVGGILGSELLPRATSRLPLPDWAKQLVQIGSGLAGAAIGMGVGGFAREAAPGIAQYGQDVGAALKEPLPLAPGEAMPSARFTPPLPDWLKNRLGGERPAQPFPELTSEEAATLQADLVQQQRQRHYGGQTAGQAGKGAGETAPGIRSPEYGQTEAEVRAGNLAAGERAAGRTELVSPTAPYFDAKTNLLQRIADAKPLQQQNKELLSQFRSRQAGAFTGAVESGPGGEIGFNRALGTMRGQAERVRFEPLRDKLVPQQVNELFDAVTTNPALKPFQRAQAGTALRSILDGEVPTPSSLAALDAAFPGVTASLRQAKIMGPPSTLARAGTAVQELALLPLNAKTVWDVSAPGRQGIFYGLAHPREAWSLTNPNSFLRRQFAALVSEDAYLESQQRLTNVPHRNLRDAAGVFIADVDGPLALREEQAASRLLSKFKFGRGSNRAYVTYLNEQSDAMFKGMLKEYGTENVPFDELRRWGKAINISRGRGDLLKFLSESKIAGVPPFWAPGLVASRMQLPFELLSSSPIVRKEMARQIVAFVGINTALLAFIKQSGIADVDMNPTSSDFGQIKIGDRRYDPWAGYRPIANLVARAASGTVTSTTTGAIREKDRIEIFRDFLRGKLSPQFGAAADVAFGQQGTGKRPTPVELAANLYAPLVAQDVINGARNGFAEGGPTGALVGALAPGPSALGAGYSEYGGDPNAQVRKQLYELDQTLWRKLSQHDSLKDVVGDAGSYDKWRKVTTEKINEKLTERGVLEDARPIITNQLLRDLGVGDVYSQVRGDLQEEWLMQHLRDGLAEEALKNNLVNVGEQKKLQILTAIAAAKKQTLNVVGSRQ